MGIGDFAGREFGWLAIAVGLVTGLAVHAGANKTGGAHYLRGALAAILSLAAIVGGQKVKAKIMKAASKDTVKAVAGQVEDSKVDATEAAEDKEESAEDDAAEPVREMADSSEFVGAGTIGPGKTNIKKSLSDKDMIWFCLSALVAYVVDKGRDGAPAAQESEASQDQDGDA